jgi:hypothetical protein
VRKRDITRGIPDPVGKARHRAGKLETASSRRSPCTQPALSGNASKMLNVEGPSRIPNHASVAGSSCTSGSAPRGNASSCTFLPGLWFGARNRSSTLREPLQPLHACPRSRECVFPEVFALERGEIPSLTLAFLGLRFCRLTFNRPTPSQASKAIHTTTCRALI